MTKKINDKKARYTETYRINAKFADEVFCPSNAIDAPFWSREYEVDPLFRTSDGVLCKPTFLGTTNNESGEYDERFDGMCKRKFGMSFSAVRSIWFSRLGKLDYYWHLIKLEKI